MYIFGLLMKFRDSVKPDFRAVIAHDESRAKSLVDESEKSKVAWWSTYSDVLWN